ncbi:MAG: sporulation protein SpoIID [Candidatus Sericytochromatia bacterium]|nr:MAG: sporulation protein SpoIID [Candidatus Sericytochromatia bacterium]
MLKKYLLTSIILLTVILISPSSISKEINIRVGIQTNIQSTIVSTSLNGTIFHFYNNKMNKVFDILPQEPCYIENKKGLLQIISNDKKLIISSGKVIIKNTEDKGKYVPLVYAGNKWYRGELEIFVSLSNKNNITVVNNLPLEEYLYGVVPSEMPSSWPIEALKTQAIAARTYALTHLGQFAKEGFDVMPTVISQVYGGAESETPITNKAVDETIGKVITYNNKLINAYYSSSSGGITEDGINVWGENLPYLKSVIDFDEDSPKYSWYKIINNTDLQNILKNSFNRDIGKILNISIVETTSSGRANKLLFEGTKSNIEIDAKKFRLASKLNSTLFKVEKMDLGTSFYDNYSIPNLFIFVGKGWGHGTGMSQWGARAMAKNGKTHVEIIKHYYQGTEISNINSIIN